MEYLKKNKTKLTFFLISILFLSLGIYKNYIYYLIPSNPIKDFDFGNIESCSLGLDYTDYTSERYILNYSNSTLELVQYLKTLNLKPLKHEKRIDESTTHYTLILESEYGDIFIRSGGRKAPNVLDFSTFRSKLLKNGDYEITDSNFDYDYIQNLFDTNTK